MVSDNTTDPHGIIRWKSEQEILRLMGSLKYNFDILEAYFMNWPINVC